MSLKTDIVVVNEFTVANADGGGSRGGTPGQYVMRYMAREGATETIAPVRLNRLDDFVLKYMARESATERAVSIAEAKDSMRKSQGFGGVAFGYGQVSLSDEELRTASKDIQNLFESGHTVMKTVMSFDEEYLRKHGIVDETFHCQKKGDYHGNIDQMKLRMAIMHGLERMSYDFDDLRYVAVIQIDTEHVHCHLAMADAGHGIRLPNGEQKGKISDRNKSLLRRGTDSWLDQNKSLQRLSSAVSYDRRNVVTFVKRWAHRSALTESTPQFLLACLPRNKNLWRAGSNLREMRKPNDLARLLVDEMFTDNPDVYRQVMRSVEAYADMRQTNEDLTNAQKQRLIDNGREEVFENSINSIYATLKNVPDYLETVRTPMIDLMSMDYDEIASLAASNARKQPRSDFVDFGFRLRTYSSRLSYHRKQREQFKTIAQQWEKADAAGVSSEQSRVLYDFAQFEQRYHAECASKYQHFLPRTTSREDWNDEWKQVADYGDRLISLNAMCKDASLRRLKNPAEAEERGIEVYGQHGGSLVGTEDGRNVLLRRIATMRASYDAQVHELEASLGDHGLTLHADAASDLVKPTDSDDFDVATTHRRAEARIEPGDLYEFNDVKALDLHHLNFDFARDVPVSEKYVRQFVATSRERQRLLDDARYYLVDTGQEEFVRLLPVDDVRAMNAVADRFESDGENMLRSRLAALSDQAQARREASSRRKSRTVSLSAGLASELNTSVTRAAAQSAQSFAERDHDASEFDVVVPAAEYLTL